ncbi:MAG: hypothetical protein QGG64_17675 [Candidatus Latescibacteria bacterium]|nr:hypothetical protein [Candidatus Latescibacterota bacterium]
MSDRVIQQCATMSNQELVRTLTIERGNFDEAFLGVAESEREKRVLLIEDFINDVHIAQDDEEGEACSIGDVLAKIHANVSLWSILTVTNCLDDVWVIQREYKQWLVHHYTDDEYLASVFYDSEEQLKSTLRFFLLLEFWTAEEMHDLNTWKPVFQSRSPAFLIKIISELGEILHTVKTPIFSQDQKGQLVVLVHPEFEKQAQDVVDENHDKLEQLYDQAEHLAEVGDWEQELRIYDILSELVPDNLAVYYNRGSVLIALDRLDEAAESLIEATVLGLPEIKAKVDLKPRRGSLSSVAGRVNPLLSLVVLSQQNDKPDAVHYPDYIDDVELLLLQILEKRPENIRILHGLAIIAELKNEIAIAIQHYRDILAIDSQNEAAQTQLAYLKQTEVKEP